MIDKDNVVDAVLERLGKMEAGECLDLRTYKRNRSVLVQKLSEDAVLVVQDGYEQARHPHVPVNKLRKLFKTLLKKEFLRSNKVRLYMLGPCDPDRARRMGRKKL